MNENDPQRSFDPLWYDRAEPDAPTGLLLNASACLLLLLMVCLTVAVRVYWFPDRLWRRVSSRIERHLRAGNKCV